MAEIPRELLAAPVSPGARVTLTALWTWADPSEPEPFVWPTPETLAGVTAQTDRSIRRHRAELLAVGLVAVERRAHTGFVLRRTFVSKPDSSVRARADSSVRTADNSVRTPASAADSSVRQTGQQCPPDRTVVSAELTKIKPGSPQSAPCSAQQRDLGEEFKLQIQQPPDPVADLHDWFERELVKRKKRRSPHGLSDKKRDEVERLLRHIEATLRCDRLAAIASQKEHLESRLAELDRSDPEVDRRIGKATAWRTGWWDYWNGNGSDPGLNAPEWTPEDARTEGVF